MSELKVKALVYLVMSLGMCGVLYYICKSKVFIAVGLFLIFLAYMCFK